MTYNYPDWLVIILRVLWTKKNVDKYYAENNSNSVNKGPNLFGIFVCNYVRDKYEVFKNTVLLGLYYCYNVGEYSGLSGTGRVEGETPVPKELYHEKLKL